MAIGLKNGPMSDKLQFVARRCTRRRRQTEVCRTFVPKAPSTLRFAGALQIVLLSVIIGVTSMVAMAQKGKKPAPAVNPPAPTNDLEKLRKEYIELTKSYKDSLEKLRTLYEAAQQKAEDRVTQSNKLFQDGLISKSELEQTNEVLAAAKLKVNEVDSQMKSADTQIAQALVETEGEKQIAKLRVPKGGLVRTASFIRYNGAAPWVLSQAGTIESFFQQRFGRPLPIAVFGQGAIHNQWHLDHRNAMDISLNPDGAEGQALIDFLRTHGIPFSAFRGAIPGVATGPHIHIGLPSHRY
jgi:hypothetical protein